MDRAISADRAGSILADVQQAWLRARIRDSTLHPVAWLLLSGLLALAWIVQPTRTDSTLTISSLMFLRFVPLFIVVGAIWRRAGTGLIVGVALFFALMGLESLSVLMWDVALPRPATRLVPHAAWLSNALYLLGILGLLTCGVTTFMLRREKAAMSRRYLQRCLQMLGLVQIALVVELTYTGLGVGTELPIVHAAEVVAKPSVSVSSR
jgi:hypothetical protein